MYYNNLKIIQFNNIKLIQSVPNSCYYLTLHKIKNRHKFCWYDTNRCHFFFKL